MHTSASSLRLALQNVSSYSKLTVRLFMLQICMSLDRLPSKTEGLVLFCFGACVCLFELALQTQPGFELRGLPASAVCLLPPWCFRINGVYHHLLAKTEFLIFLIHQAFLCPIRLIFIENLNRQEPF